MRTLYLLRHAKASLPEDAVSDFDRPLVQQGIEAARRVGELLAAEGLDRPVVVSSPAVRASQTAKIMLSSGGFEAELRFDADLYEANLSEFLKVLASIRDETEVVILVGHNPGLESLVRFVTGQVHSMTTAALLRIELTAKSWSDIEQGQGRTVRTF